LINDRAQQLKSAYESANATTNMEMFQRDPVDFVSFTKQVIAVTLEDANSSTGMPTVTPCSDGLSLTPMHSSTLDAKCATEATSHTLLTRRLRIWCKKSS